MLQRTEAIVLALQPHSDKARLLHAYTRARGHVIYMVYGLGKRQSAAQYAPMSIVEIVADEQPDRQIQQLRQATLSYVPRRTSTDPCRQAIALFVAEVLYRVTKHPMEDEDLYQFVAATAQAIDQSDRPENIHLDFLRGLAMHLGVGIDEDEHPELARPPQNRGERQEQLRQLCLYLQQHIDDWQAPKSADVLTEMFRF